MDPRPPALDRRSGPCSRSGAGRNVATGPRRTARHSALAAFSVLVAVLAGACGGGGTARNDGTEVAITTSHFDPATTRVLAGTSVTWVNHDDAAHTIRSGQPPEGDGRFGMSLDPAGGDRDRLSVTFAEPGSYDYWCEEHRGNTGTVVVEGL